MDFMKRIGQLVVLSPVCLSLCLQNFNSPTSEFQVNRSPNFFFLNFDKKREKSYDFFQFLTMLEICMFSIHFMLFCH